MNNKRCVICPFACVNETSLFQHTQRLHDGDDRLKICCNVQGCKTTSKRFCRMLRHFNRKHNMTVRDAYTRVKFKLVEADEEDQDESDLELDKEQMNRKVGKAVIDLETRHHIGGTGGNCVVEHVREVLNLVTRNNEDLLKPVSTEARRRTFYKKNFYLVKPKPILLGSGVKIIKRKAKTFRHIGYFVPFEQQLKSLMNLPEFKAFCNATRGPRDPNVFDGIFRTPEGDEIKTIYISITFDEIELVNPIGASRKIHKQYVCLFEVLNINPENRSGLETKFMVFICKNKFIQTYQTHLILSDFVRTVNKSQIGLKLDDTDDRYKIKVAFSNSDTLAANEIFGYKITSGTTYRFCRRCMITKHDLCTSFDCRTFDLRTQAQHRDHLTQLANLSGSEKRRYQRETGVVRPTTMATEIYGCSIELALTDPFHVLLEGGCLAIPLQCFLHQIIEVDQILSLKELNSIIQNWNYWKGDKTDKIPLLDEKFIEEGKKPNMKGASVYILAQELPFILSEFIDPEYPYLQNFIRILQLSQTILFSPCWSLDTVSEVREELCVHHHEFLSLYQHVRKPTPKFHFALHICQEVVLYGASRYHSTIRYESKYSILKSEKLKNFINPSKTLAFFHQKFQARHMVNKNGFINENFFKTKMTVSNVSPFLLERVPIAYQELTADFIFTKMCHRIGFGSTCYEKGTFLESSQPYEMEPTFICIECIFLDGNDDAFLGVKMYKGAEFVDHLCAFRVDKYENIILPFSSLNCRLLLPNRVHEGHLYIIRKHAARFQPLV